jgi:hypothetical protein
MQSHDFVRDGIAEKTRGDIDNNGAAIGNLTPIQGGEALRAERALTRTSCRLIWAGKESAQADHSIGLCWRRFIESERDGA